METRILLIEDNPGDARLIFDMLEEAGADGFVVDRVDRLSAALERLTARPPDAVLLDLSLPDSHGLDTFGQIHSNFSETPIIVLTGLNDEEVGMQAVRAGAQDYLVKGAISGTALTRVLRYGIERKRAEEQLRESEAQFRTLANAIPQLCWMANPDGWIFWYNQRWYDYTGTTPDEMKGWGWQSVHDPEELPEVLKRWRASIASAQPLAMVFPLRGADGIFRPFLTRAVPLFNRDGKVARWFGSNTDITEQRNTQEALRQRAEEVEKLMSVAPVGIFVAHDPQCREIVGNPTANEMYEAGEGENVSASPWPGEQVSRRLFSRDGRVLAAEELPMQQAAASGADVKGAELDVLLPSGRQMSIFGYASPLRDAAGHVRGCVGAFLDITERKRAQETQSELAAIVESTDDAIIGKTLEGIITSWNHGAQQLYGFRPDEMIGQSISIIAPPDRSLEMLDIMQAVRSEGRIERLETVRLRKDGTTVDVSVTVSPILNAAGKVIGASSIARDITERKRTEEALRASERRYRLLFERNLAAVLRTIGDGHIVDANEACARMLGCASRDELLQRQLWDFWSQPEGRHSLITRLKKERLLTGIELYLRRKDGIPVVALANMTLNGGNTAEAAVIEATFIDITERKRAVEALSESRRVLAHAEQIAHLGAWEMEISNREGSDENLLRWSDETYRIFGYEPGAIDVTNKLFVSHVHPDDRLAVRETFAEALARQHAYAVEHRILRKDGDERTLFEHAEILLDGDGRPERVIGAVQDITERKQAEVERKRLVAAIEQCAETIIITDTRGTIQYVNPTFTKVTGYSREEAVGANPRLLKSDKHDSAFFEDFWSTLLAGESWHGEMINRRKDGSLYIDELHVAPVRHADGEIVHFISNQLDVTDRKRAEAENLRLVTAIEQASEGVVITDLDGAIQYVNPAFTRITGYTSDEVMGLNPRLLKSGRHDAEFYRQLWCTILNGRTWHGEVINRRKDGTLYPEAMTITPVRGAQGAITNFIAIKQDIADRKRQEDQILASLHEKEMLLKEIHHRVKNNLQVISSLLELRSAGIPDDSVREKFRESQTRVRTMALIHEKLYRSKDFAHIDFGEYLSSLVADLFQSYQVNPDAVSFAVSGDKVLLGIDTAIACSLIVNELVSNCLKHAFPARTPRDRAAPRGLIAVAVNAGEGGKVRLVIRDNGKGFPPSLDFRNTQSLGLQLVNRLTEQVGGTIQMRANGGTEFEIEFAG